MTDQYDIDVQNELADEGQAGGGEAAEPESLRDALTQAFDKAEQTESKTDEEKQVPSAETALGAQRRSKRDPASPGGKPANPNAATATAVDHNQAPNSWRPAAREAFKQLPESARQEIHRREGEFVTALEKMRSSGDIGNAVLSTIQPYRQLFAAEGVNNPLTAIDGLLRNASTLRMGSQAQKAEVLANFIKAYDVDVNTLDEVLAHQFGGEAPKGSPNADLEAMLNQRLAPVHQLMAMMQQNQQAAVQQRSTAADNQIAQFVNESPKPYFQDVRHQMADLIDMAEARGRQMTLDEAYNIACMADPEIRPLHERAQRSYGDPQVRQADKRRASSMITGQPGGGGPGKARPSSIREALEQAWDGAATAGGRI